MPASKFTNPPKKQTMDAVNDYTTYAAEYLQCSLVEHLCATLAAVAILCIWLPIVTTSWRVRSEHAEPILSHQVKKKKSLSRPETSQVETSSDVLFITMK